MSHKIIQFLQFNHNQNKYTILFDLQQIYYKSETDDIKISSYKREIDFLIEIKPFRKGH